MSISIPKRVFSIFLAIVVVLVLSPGRMAEARTGSADISSWIAPSNLVTTRGVASGGANRMTVKDQSGLDEDPDKFVFFQTPGTAYQGYRIYNLPGGISGGAVKKIQVRVNYRGPTKAVQVWSWYLRDWVAGKWVKIGDNVDAHEPWYVWQQFTFTTTSHPSRFINNATGKIRVQLTSNDASNDAELDYEAVQVTYEPCSGTLGCVYVGPGNPIHIAYHLNGPELGSLEGAQIAMDDWSGAILGHSILFNGVQRTACPSTMALADANALVMDASIVAVLGTSCSAEAMQVRSVITGVGLSMVSPSNTGISLTETPMAGYLRVSWSDAAGGELAAEYALNALSATKAATIDDGSAFSSGVASAFATAFDASQTITGTAVITAEATDLRTELSTLAGDSPDVLFMPLFMPTGIYAVNQARATTGLETAYLITADGLWDQNLMLSTGTDLEGLRMTGPDPALYDNAKWAAFLTDFAAKFPSTDMGQFAPYGYDAFDMIAKAISSSASDLGGGALLIDLEALRTALYATNYPGITGTLDCNPDGDCAATPALGIYLAHKNAWPPVLIYPPDAE